MKILHYVKKMETIEEIANRYHVSALKLKEINKINNALNLPEVLEIPFTNNDFSVIKNAKRNFLYISDGSEFANIKRNLSLIGFKTNANLIEKFDKVLFKQTDKDCYVVGITETLPSICKKFKLNEKTIKEKNNLKSDKLFIGQILKF